MKILCLFVCLILSHLLWGQKIIIDSRLEDTLGFSRDLGIIESKLGNLNDTVKKNLLCIEVQYRGFNDIGGVDTTTIRKGILMVHKTVKEDVIFIFRELFERNFPIQKVIPINKYGLNADSSGWNDAKSMEDNNTSAFNYRFKTNSKELSPHAFGTAIDINPLFNPYEKYEADGKFTEPQNAVYDKNKSGTITDSVVTGLFDKRGWVWGGRWNNPVDYQHFDLRKGRDKKHYLMKESSLKNWYSYDGKLKIHSLYPSANHKKKNSPELKLQSSRVKQFENYCKNIGLENSVEAWMNHKLNSKENDKEKSILLLSDNANFNPLNKIIIEKLYKDLIDKGFPVDTCEPPNKKYKRYELLLKIELSENTVDKNAVSDYQVIFIPGAFKEREMSNSVDRLRFFNLMIGDDLKKSENIAVSIQREIFESLGIKALDRQTAYPEFLEKDCIKTDQDGIYCRNISELNRLNCPVVYTQIVLEKLNGQGFSEFVNNKISLLVRSFSSAVQHYFKNKS
jgi:hypothetical protein